MRIVYTYPDMTKVYCERCKDVESLARKKKFLNYEKCIVIDKLRRNRW